MKLTKPREAARRARHIPKTSESRRLQTWNEKPLDLSTISILHGLAKGDQETFLYLAYGSNLCALTFLERRGIRPLSQVNVVVPAIKLTFDLPGTPYSEPCFGNCKYRDVEEEPSLEKKDSKGVPGYHKDAWKKGLVGVVYEVTKSDYAHIIATEGGGAGYHDVLVDCYALSDDPNEEVPLLPTSTPFKAHTLYAHSMSYLRPDPAYAQPSARYLKLLTDGASEHDLPTEYRYFLENIRTYHMTTTQQQLGQFIFLALWGPIFAFIFGGGGAIFLQPDGTYPEWFAKFTRAIHAACWDSYEHFFKKTFGDGERTIGDEVLSDDRSEIKEASEKTPLLQGA